MPRAVSFTRAIGRQLAHPRGLGGWITGQVMRVANRRPTALAIDALAVEPGTRVLDLGCGPGGALGLLARRAGPGVVHGMDHSLAMLAQASARNAKGIRDGVIILTQGSFEALPYASASFDRVMASNVIYFWREPDVVMREILRVLKPGGRLAVYATDGADMAHWPIAKKGTHILYDRKALEHMLGASLGGRGVRIDRVAIGFGIHGLVATVDRPAR
jgi:ubiquinone/menaquinone biosynthesis C-methylase UbiE